MMRVGARLGAAFFFFCAVNSDVCLPPGACAGAAPAGASSSAAAKTATGGRWFIAFRIRPKVADHRTAVNARPRTALAVTPLSHLCWSMIFSESHFSGSCLRTSDMSNPADPLAWRTVTAPSLADFEQLAEQAFERLPERFRALCEGVVIHVDDFPTDEVLNQLGAQTEFDLLGLFTGIGLPFRSENVSGQMPNMVWLYRRPILDYWAEHDESLGHIVTHVLVHEIGHHFGLSDEDMEALEKSVE
jgi:predicted Zn-dependent protease with MMP-like domain